MHAAPIYNMTSSDLEKHVVQSPVQPDPSGLDGISGATKHRDDNYELYKASRDLETDPAEVKRVLRKVDYRIVPILVITYMLQYLDKNSINFASVYGLKDGTHLKGQDYAWLGKFPLSSPHGALNLQNQRLNLLFRLPLLPIPLRLPPPTSSDREIPIHCYNMLGHNPHHHPGL